MSLIKNIVTFGASGRIDSKINEHEDYIQEYKKKYSQMQLEKQQTNELLESLIQNKIDAIKSLKKIGKISKSLESKERNALIRQVGDDFETIDLELINNTLTAGQAAINATKGLTAGVSTAAGTWALVSTFGVASTGTAIGTLSGAAATNATLAWLGGGSLAAGGAGIAGGTLALGGIVALPALVLTGAFSHIKANKEIAKIEEKIMELIHHINMIESNLLQLNLTRKRGAEISQAVQKATDVFDTEFNKIYKEIYRFPVLSKSWKWTRKTILRRNYFSETEITKVAYIGGLAQELAIIIDSKIFNDDNIID